MKVVRQTKTLGEVCQLEYGKPLGGADRKSNGLYPVYGANGEIDRTDKYYFDKPTIIVGRKGSAGELNLTEAKFWPLDVTYFVTFNEQEYNLQFLYYLLTTLDLPSLARGVKPGINRNEVYSQVVKIPPLPEQQRIVGILDEAFDGIDTAKANAEKNLQNARALFESHLQSVFTQRGEGWVDAKLEDVCGFQNGFAFKSSSFRETGSPILRISNIQDGQVDLRRLVFFDPKEYRENLDRYRIVKDDLLIAMSGATTGKLGFNTESTVFYLNQRVGKFEPGKKLNKRYLYHFLSTKVEENLRISAGSAQPNLSTEQIKGLVLPLPNIDEQARIVDALESLSEETQRLESLYQRKLAALEELKKSLLHQAYTGGVVAKRDVFKKQLFLNTCCTT